MDSRKTILLVGALFVAGLTAFMARSLMQGASAPKASAQVVQKVDGPEVLVATRALPVGTILDATVWAYSADTATSTTTPPLPPGSCDDSVGGAITAQAYRAGVPIDAGTDFIGDWTDRWPDLFHELASLSRKAGMPNGAILQSATLIGARAAGQERDMGSIEPGKLANMVVLARNPLVDLKNLQSVVMTVKRGHVFPRSAFVPLTKADITDR